MEKIIQILSKEFDRKPEHIRNVIALLDEGSTIPFIARYRKEMHGSMGDTTLRDLTDRLNYLKNLEARKGEIRRSIEGQEKMTPELSEALENAATLTEAEDLYRPFKQKKRTRASMAKEKGLEPLAALIWTQSKNLPPLEKLAENYIDEEKGVIDGEEALAGASDIIAEFISDSAEIRSDLRKKLDNASRISSKAAGEEDSVYRLYYEFDQPLKKLQDHQVLALNRGEKEGFLKVSLDFDDETALQTIARDTIRGKSEAGEFIRTAAEDSWGRLLSPSLKNEFRSALTEKACEGAIRNFALNLKPLLMQPPVKGAVTMGLDPGYRNGCKVAVIDPTGKVLDTCVVYPTFNERKKQEAIDILGRMVKKHKVRHLAIGNGTASRETEQMAIEMIRKLGGGVSYMIVNEAGASVYSASKLAAKEFPEFDVNLRSAVSIARRLQDPLAELVKIDPKAIGVGQYQHDMPQKRLDESLSGVVEDCVNAVGVDLNTASAPLLQRVSGLSSAVAENIVKYREENGPFRERKQLLKVPKLGPKAFEQSAGFLRIPGGASVLDNTGVHPESYPAAQILLQQCGYTLEDVQARRIGDLPKQVKSIGEKKLAETCGIGVPTLRDIMKELMKPGRDPRDELPPPILRTDVLEISDLKPGMKLKGTVRNVIDFGAFVDIGVHQDGLVHISQIADRYIKHPSEVLTVGQVVDVTVLEVDEKKKRISLSMRSV